VFRKDFGRDDCSTTVNIKPSIQSLG
jgi:hypothetical protein